MVSEGAVHGVLMVVNRLDIVLVIEAMVKNVVSLMIDLVAIFVLARRLVVTIVFAVMILIRRLVVVRVDVPILEVVSVAVGVGIGAVERFVHGVLVVVNRLDIVLIVESVVQSVMSLVVHFMAVLVLIGRVAALMILSITMCVLIWSHIAVI